MDLLDMLREATMAKALKKSVGVIPQGTPIRVTNYYVNSDGSVEFDIADQNDSNKKEHLQYDSVSEIDVW